MNDKIALVVWSKTGNTKTMANSLKMEHYLKE